MELLPVDAVANFPDGKFALRLQRHLIVQVRRPICGSKACTQLIVQIALCRRSQGIPIRRLAERRRD